MAQITTVDSIAHTVKETKKEIDKIINSLEALETGILSLNIEITKYSTNIEQIYQPASFVRQNIIMYY